MASMINRFKRMTNVAKYVEMVAKPKISMLQITFQPILSAKRLSRANFKAIYRLLLPLNFILVGKRFVPVEIPISGNEKA